MAGFKITSRGGIDRISPAEEAASGITVDLSAGTAADSLGNTELFTGIEEVEGTGFADILTGGDGGLVRLAYAAFGLAGDDTISAGQWDLYVEPGAGRDTLIAGTSYDQISYSEYTGANGVAYDLAAGTIADPYGNTDTLTGSFEAAFGTANADSFIGNATNNVFRGLGANDNFNGATGTDAAWYDRDAQHGGTHGVVVDLQTGIARDGFGATDNLTSIESVRGTHGQSADQPELSDLLLGDDAANIFQGLGGADYIDGRAGRDLADYSSDDEYAETHGIFVHLAAEPDHGVALDGYGDVDILIDIEDIRGTNQQLGHGFDVSDVLIGSAANNNFQALGGIDYLDGGDGSDTTDHSHDHAAGGASGVYVNLDSGLALEGVPIGIAIDGFAAGNALISIENVIGTDRPLWMAPDFSDVLVGSAGANILDARGGRDILDGAAGDDTLIGGAGFDILIGGLGADIFVIDTASIIAGEYDLIADFVPGTDSIRAPLALKDSIQVFAEPGTISLLIDTGTGYYAMNAQTSATEAEFRAAITYV